MIYLFLRAVLNKYSLKRRPEEKKIPSPFQNGRQKYEEMSWEREEARFRPKEKDLGASHSQVCNLHLDSAFPLWPMARLLTGLHQFPYL